MFRILRVKRNGIFILLGMCVWVYSSFYFALIVACPSIDIACGVVGDGCSCIGVIDV